MRWAEIEDDIHENWYARKEQSVFKTDEQKEQDRVRNLQMAAFGLNMRGKCARCEGKYLHGHIICDVMDDVLGKIAVHQGCVLGSTVHGTWLHTSE